MSMFHRSTILIFIGSESETEELKTYFNSVEIANTWANYE
jgi:hypothetical protein